LTSTQTTDSFGALQAIAAELAFLSPQSVASIGVVVSALAVLKQSPQVQSQADVLALIQQEHAWAQQVEAGFVAVSEADLERLKTSYFRTEEALARPVAPVLRASPPSQSTATDVRLGEEPSLYIRAAAWSPRVCLAVSKYQLPPLNSYATITRLRAAALSPSRGLAK